MLNKAFLWKFIKFCLVGGSGMLVDFGSTYVCKEWLKINKYISNSIGFVLAATSNFFLNRLWTFQSKDAQIGVQYFTFFVISLIGLGINNAVIYLLNGKLKLNFYFSKLIAVGVVTFWNFFMNYFFNFK
ncbi:MAG: GtrA family protein [Bacteroidales bacterium]|nr:GtrA family protein [Bacteroidales bacterium]